MLINESIVKNFTDDLKNRGRQPATVESYGRDARSFVGYMADEGIDIRDVVAKTLIDYQEHLRYGRDDRHNTIRRAVIGVRQFFRFLVDNKNITASPFDQVTIPARDEALPAGITTECLDQLFEHASQLSPAIKSTRDSAILALLGLDGLKVGELINLRWPDFLDENSTGSLKILGIKKRVIKLSPETTVMLSTYLDEYRKAIPTAWLRDPSSRMFVSFKGRESISPTPQITRHGLKFMLYELGCKVKLSTLNAEMLRHHATQHMLANGKSADDIMHHYGLRRIGNIAKHLSIFSKNKTREGACDTASHPNSQSKKRTSALSHSLDVQSSKPSN